jgi:type VI secretion system protein ImpA
MILLQQVAAHFRRAEPSSPIPLLLDRAEGIAGKDFFGLLREAFPAGSLKVDEQPG